jgi:hypothetical protein
VTETISGRMLPRLLVCLLLIPTPDVVKESPSAVKRVRPIGKRRGGLAARLILGSRLGVLVDDFSQPKCCRLSASCLRKPCIKPIDLTDLAQPEHRG